MTTFGQRLKKMREQRGLSQKELAERFNLSQSTIAYYERDKKEPTNATLEKLADYFEVSVDFLLGRSQTLLAPEQSRINETQLDQLTDSDTNIGRAFFGGADKYTEEEIEVARAAARAAIEAMRKARKSKEEGN